MKQLQIEQKQMAEERKKHSMRVKNFIYFNVKVFFVKDVYCLDGRRNCEERYRYGESAERG